MHQFLHQSSILSDCMSVHILFVLGYILFSNIKQIHSIQLDVHLPIVSNKTSCIYRTVIEANKKLNQWSSLKHTNEKIHFADHQGAIGYTYNNRTIQIPHVTLFLTNFAIEDAGTTDISSVTSRRRDGMGQINQTVLEELIDSIQFSIEKELDGRSKCYYDTQIQKPLIGGPYAMYENTPDTAIQRLSNRIVEMTQKFVRKDQPIPDWVNDIPDEETKRKKISYIKKFGSPNVFDEFDPHVTVGFDDGGGNRSEFNDDRFSILDSFDWDSCGGWIDEVRIGLVGDYGTVIGEPVSVFNLTNFAPCAVQMSEAVVIGELVSAQL